ncbi:hypothetical protein [Agrobacterium pusense]|uniref:hypothetical protein n=1 Tax=Agrobacterium pusense TaxID=648995 RepID=UPI000D340E45|nr:hypothetical protein [Agrobacterium pusense]PTV72164.1 hypothetical protein DBL06_21655 [Agrobacterium pusense]
MGEQRYKVGDWVRVNDNRGAPYDYRVGDVHKVDAVLAGLVYVLGKPGMYAKRFEPWQPRVGERVKVTGNDQWAGDGEVTELRNYGVFVVLMKTGRFAGKPGGFYIRDIEPILTAAAPDKPATIKIEAGKFYKTRDGRKAKVERAHYSDSYDFVATFEGWSGNKVYKKDGKHGSRWIANNPSDDLIAEWIDEPAAKPSNDNAKPNFKVGDLIRHKTLKFEGVVKEVVNQRTVRTHWTKEGWGATDPIDSIELITPPTPKTPTIVALIENGQPKPSSTPHVHASTDSAEKEAKRLAAKYKGKQFGVFTLATTHEEAAPVYDHKWQNMAALGLKIDAIKELRAVAGLTLKGAKDAVEAWIEYENAA